MSSDNLIALLGEAAFKVTAVLFSAWLATAILRKASAGARHLVWTFAVCCALFVPIFTATLPSLDVPVLAPPEAEEPTPLPARFEAEPAALSMVVLHDDQPATTVSSSTTVPFQHTFVSSPPPPREEPMALPSLATVLVSAWALISALLLLRMALGRRALHALARRAEPLVGDRLTQAMRLARALGIARPVRFLVSDEAPVPMTFGALKPVVVLPKSADAWTEDRIALVLLHELAHVRRFDAL